MLHLAIKVCIYVSVELMAISLANTNQPLFWASIASLGVSFFLILGGFWNIWVLLAGFLLLIAFIILLFLSLFL
jgi:hypothetical protein